jgi:hypothetical protein
VPRGRSLLPGYPRSGPRQHHRPGRPTHRTPAGAIVIHSLRALISRHLRDRFVVHIVVETGKPIAEVARDLGIHTRTLGRGQTHGDGELRVR